MKIITLFVSLCLIMTNFAACGETVNTTDNSNNSTTSTSTAISEETDYFAALPEKDLGGRDIRFVARLQYEDELCVTESNGDVLNDAVYNRNRKIQDKFNVNFTWNITGNEYSDMGKKEILSGEDAYDILMIHSRMAFNFMQEGYLHDWNDNMPYIDLSQPWWSQDMKKNIAIGNKIYFMSGDISYYFLADTQVMLFNKRIINDMGIDSLYDTVRDGKWTFDYMTSIAKNATYDLNGDGEIDPAVDNIGYITSKWRGPNFCYIAGGQRLITINNEGIPELTLNKERAENIFNRYLEFLRSDSAAMPAQVENDEMIQYWMSGHVTFFDGLLKYASNMRDMNDDFGILPLPKYDEEQDAYYSTPGAGINFYAVPITAKDTENISLILEAMAILGHDILFPAYYNSVLKSKYSRDEESAEMLDLIRENIIIDFGAQIYAQDENKLNSIGFFLAGDERLNFASFYDSNIGTFNEKLQEVIDLMNQ